MPDQVGHDEVQIPRFARNDRRMDAGKDGKPLDAGAEEARCYCGAGSCAETEMRGGQCRGR